MISLAGAATNPGMFTNPVTGAIGLGAALAPAVIKLFNPAHKKANEFVQGFENPFGQKLAEISALSATDPEAARQMFDSEWGNFKATTDAWIAKGGDHAKVARQALNNAGLMNTVRTLANGFGVDIGSGGGGSSTTTATGGGTNMPGLGDFINIAGNIAGRYQTRGGGPVTTDDGGGIDWGDILRGGIDVAGRVLTRPPTTTVNVNNPNNPSGGGTTDTGGGGTGTDGGFNLEKFLSDWLPLLAVAGTGIIGGKLSSDAAEKIAKIQADTAQKGLDMTYGMWDIERKDRAPFRNISTNAAYTLSDGLGLSRTPLIPETQADRPELQFLSGSNPVLAPRAGRPNSIGSGGSGSSPNFDAIAARFQTQPPPQQRSA